MANIEPNLILDIPGADKLVEWFGKWPSFHDAEVLSIVLNRNGASCVRIHTWEMTSEVDAKGYYVLRKHVIVSFFLEELNDIELYGFSCMNVISSLVLTRSEEGFKISLGPCYGVTGSLIARKIRIEIQPGAPTE